MKKKLIYLTSVLTLVVAGILGCGAAPQLSGVKSELLFDTRACDPETQYASIRNPYTDSSQRLMGVMLESGLEDNKYFKITSVQVNGVDKTVEANQATEVILPAGGVLDVAITYNPTVQTEYGKKHHAVLSTIFNGPDLGVIQVDLYGEAPVSKPGCGQGERFTFKVDKVIFKINDEDEGNIPDQELTTFIDNKDTFSFVVDSEGVATLAAEDFPVIQIDVPNQDPLQAFLEPESAPFVGTYDSDTGSLEFPDTVISAGGIFGITGLLTTGLSTTTSADGYVEAEGKPLTNDGKMNLGFTGPLPTNLGPLMTLNGGCIGAIFEMTKVE